MKKTDAVFQELGQLYDFQKKVKAYRFKRRRRGGKDASSEQKSVPLSSTTSEK
jgi:hypothetical protein